MNHRNLRKEMNEVFNEKKQLNTVGWGYNGTSAFHSRYIAANQGTTIP